MLKQTLAPVDPNDEIHKLFGNTLYPPAVVDDFSRLYNALNTETMMFHFKKLEVELKKRKGKNPKHVITEFMKDWCIKNQFNLPETINCIETKNNVEERVKVTLPEGAPGVIPGFLDFSEFNSLISLGLITKDIGAGVSHGEFSHFLQIYVLVEEYKRNPDFLAHTPQELFKMMTDFAAMDESVNTLTMTPWSFILDKGPKEGGFGDPDYLNAELIGALAYFNSKTKSLDWYHLPILSDLIRARADKRNPDYYSQPGSFFSPYVDPDVKYKYYAKTKYTKKNKSVLVINNVYFNTDEKTHRELIYDDILHDLARYKNYFPKDDTLSLPEMNPNDSIIDKLIHSFNVENYQALINDQQDINKLTHLLNDCRTRLLDIEAKSNRPGKILHHRELFKIVQNVIYQVPSLTPDTQRIVKSIVRGCLDEIEKHELNPSMISMEVLRQRKLEKIQTIFNKQDQVIQLDNSLLEKIIDNPFSFSFFKNYLSLDFLRERSPQEQLEIIDKIIKLDHTVDFIEVIQFYFSKNVDRYMAQYDHLVNGGKMEFIIKKAPGDVIEIIFDRWQNKFENNKQLVNAFKQLPGEIQLRLVDKIKGRIKDGFQVAQLVSIASVSVQKQIAEKLKDQIGEELNELSTVLEALPEYESAEFARTMKDKIKTVANLCTVLRQLPEKDRIPFAVEMKDLIKIFTDAFQVLAILGKRYDKTPFIKSLLPIFKNEEQLKITCKAHVNNTNELDSLLNDWKKQTQQMPVPANDVSSTTQTIKKGF